MRDNSCPDNHRQHLTCTRIPLNYTITSVSVKSWSISVLKCQKHTSCMKKAFNHFRKLKLHVRAINWKMMFLSIEKRASVMSVLNNHFISSDVNTILEYSSTIEHWFIMGQFYSIPHMLLPIHELKTWRNLFSLTSNNDTHIRSHMYLHRTVPPFFLIQLTINKIVCKCIRRVYQVLVVY